MSDLRSYDGMLESDALLAIDGEGKWVLCSDAANRIAALEAENARMRSLLRRVLVTEFRADDNGTVCIQHNEHPIAEEIEKEAQRDE